MKIITNTAKFNLVPKATIKKIYKSLNSIEKQTQPYQKPCQYKNNSYLRTSYYGKNKLFEYSEIHGFNRAKGLLNREDVINPFFDPICC